MSRTEARTQIPRPDITREQAVLMLDIARGAERVLNNRGVDRADFSEPPTKAGVKNDYVYRSDKSKQYSSLAVRTEISDEMRIGYNASVNVASLSYREEIFGSFLQTTIVKDQNGDMVILHHYTNDPVALTEALESAKHRLEYADQELTKREQQGIRF